MLYNKTINRGITLIEILVSISILIMLSLMGIWHFSKATDAEALRKDKQGLVAMLLEARSLALASKNAERYGVHIEEFQAVFFEGGSYVIGNVNNRYQPFNKSVHLLSASLNGGGSEVLFSRLTGETNNFGTITLSLINDPLSSTIVTINDSGMVQ